MADKKPFHLSVVDWLEEDSGHDDDPISVAEILKFTAKTAIPEGKTNEVIVAVIDTALRIQDEDVKESAVAVIVAHDGRAILADRFTTETENEVLGEMVRMFNQQEGVELILIPQDEPDSEPTPSEVITDQGEPPNAHLLERGGTV